MSYLHFFYLIYSKTSLSDGDKTKYLWRTLIWIAEEGRLGGPPCISGSLKVWSCLELSDRFQQRGIPKITRETDKTISQEVTMSSRDVFATRSTTKKKVRWTSWGSNPCSAATLLSGRIWHWSLFPGLFCLFITCRWCMKCWRTMSARAFLAQGLLQSLIWLLSRCIESQHLSSSLPRKRPEISPPYLK